MDPQPNVWSNAPARLELPYPLRMHVIGATGTGKTLLIRRMILREDFGPKERLDIMVFSPVPASLRQAAWDDLQARGWSLTLLDTFPDNPCPSNPNRLAILIIDDVDNLRLAATKPKTGLPLADRVDRLFCVESHHSDLSVVMISHKFHTGAAAARDSADFVLLTPNRGEALAKLCKELNLSREDAGAVCRHLLTSTSASGWAQCFNHMLICQRPGPVALWQIDSNIFTDPGVFQFKRPPLTETT